jgi:membrane-associated phospholipid phosphatase
MSPKPPRVRATSFVAPLVALSLALGPRTGPLAAQRALGDSSAPAPASAPWVTRRDADMLGVAVLATAAVAPLDRPISDEFAEPQWSDDRTLRDAASDAAFFGGEGPFVASAGLYLFGVASGIDGLASFGLHNDEAIALATVLAGVTKGIAGRALPGVSARHEFSLGRGFHDDNGPFVSFPSGHTAAAFAMAATLTGEVANADSAWLRLVEPAAYAGAVAVGVARVYQRVHWPSDLPLAAAFGTWSGRAVQAHVHSHGAVGSALRGLSVGPGMNGRALVGWSSAQADQAARVDGGGRR